MRGALETVRPRQAAIARDGRVALVIEGAVCRVIDIGSGARFVEPEWRCRE